MIIKMVIQFIQQERPLSVIPACPESAPLHKYKPIPDALRLRE